LGYVLTILSAANRIKFYLCSTSLSSSSSLHCHWGCNSSGGLCSVLEGCRWWNSDRRCWYCYHKL